MTVWISAIGILGASWISAATLIQGGRNTEWRYLDEANAPPAAWRETGFDDAQWKRGRAGLGYAQDDVVTRISFGTDPRRKHPIAYFRHEFELSTPPSFQQLIVLMRVDDGAIVYLNGKELVRENVEGQGTAARVPKGRVVETEFHRHVAPAAGLVAGRNCVAVEVYQGAPNSSDLFFDLVFQAYAPAEEPPVARVSDNALEVARTYLTRHYVPAGVRIPDGYADGGRSSRIAADGTVKTGREAIVVDRNRDDALQRHLAYARSTLAWNLPERERAALLALYVDRIASPESGRRWLGYACEALTGEYRGRELLIGKTAGAGVCRHRSLLFKLMADAAGLRAALVRGNFGSPRSAAAHTWNEVRLENGETVIVDAAIPLPGWHFPLTTDPAAQRYLTVSKAPYYPPTPVAAN